MVVSQPHFHLSIPNQAMQQIYRPIILEYISIRSHHGLYYSTSSPACRFALHALSSQTATPLQLTQTHVTCIHKPKAVKSYQSINELFALVSRPNVPQRPRAIHSRLLQPLHRNRPHICPNLHLDSPSQRPHRLVFNPHPRRPSLLLQPGQPQRLQSLPQLRRQSQRRPQNGPRILGRPRHQLHRRCSGLLSTTREMGREERRGTARPAQPRTGEPLARPR
jgi:hypothetical protein